MWKQPYLRLMIFVRYISHQLGILKYVFNFYYFFFTNNKQNHVFLITLAYNVSYFFLLLFLSLMNKET